MTPVWIEPATFRFVAQHNDREYLGNISEDFILKCCCCYCRLLVFVFVEED